MHDESLYDSRKEINNKNNLSEFLKETFKKAEKKAVMHKFIFCKIFLSSI